MFRETLRSYMDAIPCSAGALSEASGLSASVISRYLGGSRRPKPESHHLQQLADGICALAMQRGLEGFSAEEIASALRAGLAEGVEAVDPDEFATKLNALITQFEIRNIDLARALNFDASYLSKVRAGNRHFADPESGAIRIAEYVVQKYDAQRTAQIAEFAGEAYAAAADREEKIRILAAWLMSQESVPGRSSVGKFLRTLDTFDLEQYIRAIRFDEMKVPPAAPQLRISKACYGLKEMMESEISFLKMTVLSKKTDPVLFYSDMPMTEMSKDPEFPKKWMIGLAMMLKKGLHLNNIHNVDRPFEEMMLGLEAWIPMYMTGQISPYYLKGVNDQIFLHFLRVSGAAAVEGSAIAGHHSTGRYFLTNRKQDLQNYQLRAKQLLEKATPLMHIYRAEAESLYRAFLARTDVVSGARRSILSAPPLHALADGLLEEILAHNDIAGGEAERIRTYVSEERARMAQILAHSPVEERVPLVTEEEFAEFPVHLPLAGLFSDRSVVYPYELYRAHLAEAERLADGRERYALEVTRDAPFRSILITVCEGQWAMISKDNAPAIHFVMHHPRMVQALWDLQISCDSVLRRA